MNLPRNEGLSHFPTVIIYYLLLILFLCIGEGELLSERFQNYYFIYFFQIIHGVKREGRLTYSFFLLFIFILSANERNSLKTIFFSCYFLLFIIIFLRLCYFNLYIFYFYFFLLFSFFIIKYFL